MHGLWPIFRDKRPTKVGRVLTQREDIVKTIAPDRDKHSLPKTVADHGCPLVVHAGSHASEYQDDYSIGAWMGPATPIRSVCDSCVRKIRRGEVTNYRLNEATLEVTERCDVKI